jgi:hypothetical protein
MQIITRLHDKGCGRVCGFHKTRTPNLIAQHYRQAAPSRLRKSDAHNFHSGVQTTQENLGGRMKTECRRDKIDDRRSGLQRHIGRITVARKIFPLKMAADAQPAFCPLEQEDRMFDGFQFQPARTSKIPCSPAVLART